MLEYIVHYCYTGFGDCVVGYVSCYLLKRVIEHLYSVKNIGVIIAWPYVKCPYIKPIHLNNNRPSRLRSFTINCLYHGADGIQGFRTYYNSNRLCRDISTKTHLKFITNQYIGSCLIDQTIDRQMVVDWTYQAYDYFWNQVIDHSLIPPLPYQCIDKMCVIYVRLGDQYLCDNDPNYDQSLSQLYNLIDHQQLDTCQRIVLIGDINNNKLKDTFVKTHGNCYQNRILDQYNYDQVIHSIGVLSNQQWVKIFHDLYMILQCHNVYIMTNFSNFTRIVLFLRNKALPNVTVFKNDNMIQVDDLSNMFAKHYQF